MAWKKKYTVETSQISLRLPTDLLSKVDEKAKTSGKGRSDVLVNAIAADVKHDVVPAAPDADAFS